MGMITDFNCDHRLHGDISRDKQSRHSEILADRMQFMTMNRDAAGIYRMLKLNIRKKGDDC